MDALLTTARLLLRPHALTDVPFMIALNADPEVVRYTGDSAFADDSEARAVVERLMAQYADRRMGRFIVEERRGGPVGWCGLRWNEDQAAADLGFRFLRAAWGRGYATEAGAACVRYGFEDLGLPRLIAHAMPGNGASIRVLEKLGFRCLGPTMDRDLPVLGFEMTRPAILGDLSGTAGF